ncbi:AraC family transcriptional regulator [Streptomyces sp. NBRC 110611]|uniref:helix-turn-helix transcriptional regulator n=1 Tax=Streptomyces sp. NBRC 110611 TaxID=1621259 RepID=UPI00082C32E2|nr:helix-turn-helix transcriptional regulator [Streptomyces sp. NBRC 110611]GAU66832.1 AraC family transcriptional regulator [Streptomyces sp. NBRC 110611]
MSRVHQLIGAAGSTASDATYAAYYASIAQTDEGGDGTVRHRLRPEVGDGTIEVTPLRSGFHIVRYDVAFTGGHQVGYAFPDDHFELEHCVDGRMYISPSEAEAATVTGDLHTGGLYAGSVALSPRCATAGVVAHADGERYRAVSITGTWTGLESYLRGLGADALPAIGPENIARERYLGRSPALLPVAGPLEEIFLHRRSSPGRLLFMQSRLVAALAALIDGLTVPPPTADARHRAPAPALDEHEVAALRRVPELLWQQRHTPPTLAGLARASSMSVRRLTTGFRALYGASVGEYHRRRCLDRAAALLVETDWPVARIGHEVGYASPSNFGYAFRRDRGTTPARFRQAHS